MPLIGGGLRPISRKHYWFLLVSQYADVVTGANVPEVLLGRQYKSRRAPRIKLLGARADRLDAAVNGTKEKRQSWKGALSSNQHGVTVELFAAVDAPAGARGNNGFLGTRGGLLRETNPFLMGRRDRHVYGCIPLRSY